MAEFLYGELNPILPVDGINWGAQVNYLSKDWQPWDADKIVVHYGGNAVTGAYDGIAREKTVLRIYEQSHLSRGWRGLAYNYAIGMSGQLYVIRAEQRSGATSGDYEDDGIPENDEARAVLFIMGGEQIPTDAALETFSQLWQLTPEASQLVIVHKDVKNTGCPGDFLTTWMHAENYKPAELPPQEEEMDWSDIVADETFALAYDLDYIQGNPAVMPEYYFADGPASEDEKKNAYNVIMRNQMLVAKGLPMEHE